MKRVIAVTQVNHIAWSHPHSHDWDKRIFSLITHSGIFPLHEKFSLVSPIKRKTNFALKAPGQFDQK